MSTQNQLPAPQAAYDHLFNNVHSRVFFGRLAAYGYEPGTQKQAEDLLKIAGRLRNVAAESEKAAQDSSPFAHALNALDHALGNTQAGTQVKQAEAETAIKSAAATLMADPSIYNSVLSLAQAEIDAA